MRAFIASAAASNSVTYESVAPALVGIATSLTQADTSLKAIVASNPTGLARRLLSLAFDKRQSGNELADLVAGIVIAVLEALNTLVGSLATIPLLAPLLLNIDTALSGVLVTLGLLLASVLVLVANL